MLLQHPRTRLCIGARFHPVGNFQGYPLEESAAPMVLGLFVVVFPALTGWANVCRATGASQNESPEVQKTAQYAGVHSQCQESSRSVLSTIRPVCTQC